MKINQVYQYKNTKLSNPYVVLTKKTKEGYSARRVTLTGEIGVKPILIPLRAVLTPIKDAKVIFMVEMPKGMRDKLRYSNLIDRALETKRTYQKIKHKDKHGAELLRRDMVRLALSSFEIQNINEGRAYNLRDFAKSMKFKKYDTFYSWVIKHLDRQYNKEHYEQIKTCANATLVRIVEHYRTSLISYKGFSKEIDKRVDKHFMAYVNEYAKRTKVKK